MRETEKRFFETGVEPIDLMESAARQLCEALIKQGKHTCVFACGAGGNGGDGYAAARLFAQRGGRAIVLSVAEPKSPDAKANFERAKGYVFAMCTAAELDSLPVPDMWCDCIFGIGLNRSVSSEALRVIERINADASKGAKVVSCDIPSGLDSDTGRPLGECVHADMTVTFEAYKPGHLIGKGMEYCGETVVSTIGIPQELYPTDYAMLFENSDVQFRLPETKRCAHKNNLGHLLIVAGSRGMAGAAVMCTKAALRSGVGLVTVACPESIVDILQISAPSAMCIPLPEKDSAMTDEAALIIKNAIAGKSAVAIGPGLSVKASAECVNAVLDSGIKTVFDADALNIISANGELKQKLNAIHAVTPHPGEAARLTGEKGLTELEYAKRISEFGCAALVKGAASVVNGKKMYISASGCAGMAKGGSGDVLTGITGALLARGMEPTDALICASQIHGCAGEKACAVYGEMAMQPTDIIDFIGKWNDSDKNT